MSLIRQVLRKPYTVGALLVVLCLLGLGEARRMPIDIFPEIDIPVVSVVWTYSGMSADEIQNRILSVHQRQLASVVDDIERIEATSYTGVGVEKIYLHEGADVTRAVSQLSASALTALKYMPRNLVPPLVIRYGATDVPIIQLSLSSESLADNQLNDAGQNIIRPALAVVRGAEVPQPYGGKPRVIMADIDPTALSARGLTPADVSAAIQRQNIILPAGTLKAGPFEYPIRTNNAADTIERINAYPIKDVDGRVVFLRDVAHVHDGFQAQTNAVTVNGRPGVLMVVRKTGGVSTLGVIAGLRNALPDIAHLIPSAVHITPLFDQSIFVSAAIQSVVLGGFIAAVLTALMIILFLGDLRLTVIILASIPVSIIAAILALGLLGHTLNIMTLGGFALAVGILVDNGTVVIENIERHLRLHDTVWNAIQHGAEEVALPTVLATLSICIVFIPVFLLEGTAKYLFSPLSLAVILALLASLVLSFTLVPTLFRLLVGRDAHGHPPETADKSALRRLHLRFNRAFDRQRGAYERWLRHVLVAPRATLLTFTILGVCALATLPFVGENFFPAVDAGLFRLHVRAAPGTRLEATRALFSRVEQDVREIAGPDQVETALGNIGLPYSGTNIALSDTATVGTMDGELLVSLRATHRPTADILHDLRAELPRREPGVSFFFQPADIVNQVLNFGQPAPIDIRVIGKDAAAGYAQAQSLVGQINALPGVVDAHVFQVPDAPAMTVDVNRTLAAESGLAQDDVANSLLIATGSTLQVAPNFYLDPSTHVSYPLIAQIPPSELSDTDRLGRVPVGNARAGEPLFLDVLTSQRSRSPLALSQFNIRPVFDIHADVEGRDLGGAAEDIERVLARARTTADPSLKLQLSGQVETMRSSFQGLVTGIALALVLVYLFLVISFQSWLEPLVALASAPFALAGSVLMLYLTMTTFSVPALMGALMCIGLATANSILVVAFARERHRSGVTIRDAAFQAGATRLRPVIMTAAAMALGMIPMATGFGEGGEQNAPLARAVIGGLILATPATLSLVPLLYARLHARRGSEETAHVA